MSLFGQFRGSRGTTAILPSDIAVFIVGPSGSGKSQFMSILLRNANFHVRASKAQRPGTTEVHAERCRFGGMKSDIVIVDTPSFCTYMEPDGEEVMREWMESNYTQPCKAAGIIYMHNLAYNPEDANLWLSKHLGVFWRTCRQNLFPSVIHVVPTLSSEAGFSDTRFETSTAQLQRQANAEGARLANGGRLFDGNPETAWDIVQGLLNDNLSTSQANDELKVAEDDYVIFVVGPTGAGKTRFTRQLSKSRYVARGRGPGTKSIEVWRCKVGNGPVNVIVIDTPSFHTGHDNVHAEDTITERLEPNFTHDTFEKCHSGILFLHSLDSDPTCDEMLMLRHLETFAEVFPGKFKVPSRVYVVPTSNSNSTRPCEKRGQRLSQLNAMMEALNGHGNCTWHASMFPGIFKGQPETAWSAALLLLKDISQTRRAKESIPSLDGSALKDLADLLFKEFKKISGSGDFDAIITFGRTAVKFTPPQHLQCYSALINLVDLLSERFNEEGLKEDLDEIITLRRDALKHLSPDNPQGLTIHLELDESLSQRFRSKGALVDLEEIISLRRVVSKSTLVSDQYKPLLGLADSLYEKYQKMGSLDDLEEALRLVHITSQLCPIKYPDLALSQENLARSLKAKIRSGTAPTRLSGLETDPLSSSSSIIRQLIREVVNETLRCIPLRLLHTPSGVLCDRDAQLSIFEDSRQYKRLLSRRPSPTGQQLEAEIKDVVLQCFGYAMLSHRWGSGEPFLRDVEGKNIHDLDPTDCLEKLQTFCVHALERNLQWAWSDTCCIDKGSSAEVQEAIGSMFSWYQQSSLTIVYLADVGPTGSLADSIWFRRGWTLQELLASNTVLFYAHDWSLYVNGDVANHKTDPAILEELCRATQIAERHLINFDPGLEDARSRLCWASHRRTTRAEDIAYSLFGIFDVYLPILYGEGAEHALGRLLAEIISRSGDVSVLDWVGEPSSFHSCFPAALVPYQIMPLIQPIAGDPAEREGLDVDKAQRLYDDLARLPLARFIAERMVLPSVIYPVMAVTEKVSSAKSSRYTYQIHASRLTSLEVTLSARLQENTGHCPYILVRPWNPQSLQMQTGCGDDAIWNLLEQLEQPFNALLLERSLHNQYRRIACDCVITACVQDLASILDSEVLTLEVV